MATLRFPGAAGTVTGSKFLLQVEGARILLDCGLYQGLKELRLRNRDPLPLDAATIDHVVLTHAHVDHSGYLPRLFGTGFHGAVHATPATGDLLRILLADAGHLQEEEAEYHNRRDTSKHRPALPLYTAVDGARAAERVAALAYGETLALAAGCSIAFARAGHILGAATATLDVAVPGGARRIVFSGDVGRYDAPILPDPAPLGDADYVVVESTYGDRRHDPAPIGDRLERVVRSAVAREGAIVVPAFAVGRTPELLYHLSALQTGRRIPRLPIYVDSPMAIDATAIYRAHLEEFDDEMRTMVVAADVTARGAKRPSRAYRGGLASHQRRAGAGADHLGQWHGHRGVGSSTICGPGGRTHAPPCSLSATRRSARAGGRWKRGRGRYESSRRTCPFVPPWR